MTDVFISYSRKDKPFVQVLHQALTKSKYDAWVDWEDIPLTADWWDEIKTGIEAADTFIFVISPDSIASRVCGQEIDHAVEHNKRLVPIVRHEGFDMSLVQPALGRHNWLFFREHDDFEGAFSSLVEALNTDLAHVKTHTQLLVRSQEWNHKERNPDLLLRGTQLEAILTWITESADQEPRLTPGQREYVAASSKAESDRQEAEIQRQQKELRRQRQWLGLVGTAFVIASGLGILAFSQFQVAEARRKEVETSQIETLATSAEAFLNSNQGLEGLLYGLQAARRLEGMDEVPLKTRFRVVAALQQALNNTPERNRLMGHSDQIWYVTLSPDEQLIAVASRDQTASLWTLEGEQIAHFEGHTEPVSWIAVSPDNQRIATASEDSTIKLWSREGDLLKTLTGHRAQVRSITFTPDGRQLVSASRDGTVKFWTLEGSVVKTLQAHAQVCHASFSPNGQMLLTFSCGSEAKLWTPDGELITRLPEHTGQIIRGVFSPDSQRIAASTLDGDIKVWNVDGTELSTPEGHTQEAWGLSFSADGQTLYSAAEDGTFSTWTMDGELLERREDITSAISSIAVSADGETLILGDRGGAVRLWKPGLPSVQENEHIQSVGFSPDGQTLITGSHDFSVKLWTMDGIQLRTFRNFSYPIVWADFEPDGAAINVGTWSGVVQRLSLSGDELQSWEPLSSSETLVSFSPNGDRFARADVYGSIQIESTSGETLAQIETDEDRIRAIAFSPDGNRLASAGDEWIKIWTVQGDRLATLSGHTSPVTHLAFSPDGQRLASASFDRTVKLWTLEGEELATLEGHTAPVFSVAFSPDGEILASGGSDETVKLWTVAGDELVTLQGQGSPIFQVRFSPDGQTLVGTDEAGHVLRWTLNFEDLLVRSCHELRHYLKTSLSERDRTLCDGVERDWLAEGEALARRGAIAEAVAMFETALKVHSHLNFDPHQKAQQIAVAAPLKRAAQQVANGQLPEAIAAYTEALAQYPDLGFDPEKQARQEMAYALMQQAESLISEGKVTPADIETALDLFHQSRQMHPTVSANASHLNLLCWDGALRGYAARLIEVCHEAVALAPNDPNIRDSRGMARALTGDMEGAIADFQYFVDRSGDAAATSLRREWIEAINAGENPFTPEVLERLQ